MIRTVPRALLDAAGVASGYRFVAADGTDRLEPYAALLDAASRLGGALRARGLRAGDRVAIIVPEADGFLRAFFGASVAGIVPVPLAFPFDTGNLGAYLQTITPLVRASGARAIVTTAPLRTVLGTVQAGAPAVGFVAAWDDLRAEPLAPVHEPRLDDPALLQFTSGSTSEPKGVVLTHANLAANVEAIIGPHGLAIERHDVGVSWLPLFHDMGLIGLGLVPLYYQGEGVFLSPAEFVKRPVAWLGAISRYRATISFAPTFAYAMCVRRVKPAEIDRLDLSSWRVAGCGAEPVHAATLADFARTFARAGFRAGSLLPAYGLAESTLAVTFSPLGRGLRVDTVRASTLAAERRATPCAPAAGDAVDLVSCGRPFAGHAVRVVDDRGRAVAERVVGEILVSGPSVMRGYLDERRSSDALRDGWLWTGDLGYQVDGELYVCGRRKETIVVHGRNYFPQDLEWAAAQVPGVRPGRVAAFAATAPGQPDRVVVVVEREDPVAADALETAVRAQVLAATGLAIDEIVVAARGTIARTTSGKVQRARLRARYEAGMPLGPRRADRFTLARHVVSSQLGYARAFARQLGQRVGLGSGQESW